MKNLFLKVVLMILMLTMLVSVGITVSATEYPDEGYWANEAIDAAIANGLLQGKGNGNIDSETNLTRAEMAAIMVRAFGASVKADVSQYVDLDPSAWYYDEFAKAVQMRVFEGDGTGYMYPNDNITREEVFTVVARAMVLSDSDHSSLNKFGDSNQISSWARDYMSVMATKSYVNGDNVGNVNPKEYITRAEFAQLMYNIYKTYYLTTGSYSDTVDTACVMINTESVNLTNVVVEGDLIIGDGANLSTIKLTNVTIEGRLLVRGSARIELEKTTVGEMVVVNNYNSVVHFDNYKTESVFDGIVTNTKATFKQRSGGGGGGGSYVPPASPQYVVEYYIEGESGNYTLHHTQPATTVSAGQSVTADTTLKKPEGFEYNPTNTLNYVSDVAPSTGTLTLKVYYDRIKYQYTVEYYKQNADNLSYYDKVDSVTINSKYGLTVSADRAEDKYQYFDLNTTKSEHWSGKVPANNDLVLKVYYDREKYNITFNYGTQYPGAAATPITAVYGQKIYTLLPQPEEWPGYYLEGWYDGTTKVDVNYTVPGTNTDSIEISAKWVDGIAYKVVYHLQDVDSDSYTNTYSETYPSTVDTTIKLGVNDLLNIDGFEYVSNANEDLEGVVSETETLTLHVYYNRKIVSYIVEYYEERVSLDGYESTPFKTESGSGRSGAYVEAAEITHPGFAKNDSMGILDGYIPVTDNKLVLKVYYDRETFDYMIKYYQQNVEQNGYVEVTEDTITGSQEYGTLLTADTPSDKYEGFVLNTADNDEWSATIPANNDLVLKVFYDRGRFDYTVVYHIEDLNGAEFKITETKNDVFGKEVSVTPEDKTGFDVNESKSTTKGIVTTDGKLVLEVYYDRIRYDVTFNGNGYTEAIAPLKDVMYGTKIYGLLPTIERDGYVLEGWYDDITGTKVDDKYVLVDDVTLEARWEAADAIYYVVYHKEGETVGSYSDTDVIKVQKGSETGKTVEADINFEIEGYEYDTVKHNGEVPSGIIPETGTLELHVYYKRATFDYTVKTRVEEIDGTYTETPETKHGRYGTTVTVTPDPATGYETNTTVSLLSGVVKVDNSLELVVQYDRAKFYYTIKHLIQDADLDGYNILVYQHDKDGKFGTEVSADTTKKYTGFVLNEIKNTEWKGNIPAEDYKLVLNVYYDREKYTVTYNTDGGTEIADDTAYYGVDFVLPGKDSTTKDGWTLKSWDVNGKEYTPGTTVSRIADNTAIKAVWEEVTPDIKYGSYVIKYYKQNATGGYDYVDTDDEGPNNMVVGNFTITPDADKYEGFILNNAYKSITKAIVEGQTTTFEVRYDIKPAYVTVTFIDNGSVVGTVELTTGNSMADENESFPNASWSEDGYVKDTNISPIYAGDKAYTHTVNWGWWYNPTTLKWEQFTKDTEVNSDIEVSLKVKEFAAWVYADVKPDGFPFDAYYESDTRFADTIKDILYTERDLILEALDKTEYWDTVKEKLANYKLINSIDLDDNIEMQNILIKFSQVLGGEEETRKFIVDTAKESFGTNVELTKAFNEYVVKVIESSDPSKVIGLLEKAIIHEIDYDANSLPAIKEMLKKVLADEAAFESITNVDPSTLTDFEKEYIIEETCKILETEGENRIKVIDTAVEYLITPAHRSELEDLIDYSMTYLNNHPEERDLIVEDIIDEVYSAELDTLVDELVKKDQFTVTSKISFVAEGLKNKLLTDYSYDSFIAAQIPEKLKKVFEIYPESKVKEIYNNAVDYVIEQVDDAIAVIDADPISTAKVDSGLTAIFNPVTDVYIPLYEGVLTFIEDKTNGYYFYYDENMYLQELIKLLSPDSLFEYIGNQSDELSGYKIKTLEYYYDLAVKAAILGDDAILWYYDNCAMDEVERVTDSYQKLILKYVNVAADMLDRYAKDGTLPNQKLSPIEQAIKNKYPKLVSDLVAWYKDSDINKDYNDEDFQKVQDKVREAFEYVNITTDEFFDLILNNKRLENIDKLDKYFEKISEDEYKVEAKGNIVKFLRKVVDA